MPNIRPCVPHVQNLKHCKTVTDTTVFLVLHLNRLCASVAEMEARRPVRSYLGPEANLQVPVLGSVPVRVATPPKSQVAPMELLLWK